METETNDRHKWTTVISVEEMGKSFKLKRPVQLNGHLDVTRSYQGGVSSRLIQSIWTKIQSLGKIVRWPLAISLCLVSLL